MCIYCERQVVRKVAGEANKFSIWYPKQWIFFKIYDEIKHMVQQITKYRNESVSNM